MTGSRLAEIRCERFDATGADDHVRIVYQYVKGLISIFAILGEVKVKHDRVPQRQVSDAVPELVEWI